MRRQNITEAARLRNPPWRGDPELFLIPDFNFQKTVDSLYVKKNIDIYITGSNAYLLSGELATLLSGRYIEINMLPFSFAEFCEIKGGNEKDSLLATYQLDCIQKELHYMNRMNYFSGKYNNVFYNVPPL